jgi:hypothetical protein
MPRLVFPYVRPNPIGKSYPMIPVWLQNPQQPLMRQRIYALVDTGADVCLFNSALLPTLGLQIPQTQGLPLTGINTGAPVMGWPFDLVLGVATDASPEIFWPNGRILPVPVFFNPNVAINLLGRTSFLDRCALTVNAWIGQVVLDF